MRRVYVELAGGLGNQIFQTLAGLSIAESTNRHLIAVNSREFLKSSHGNSVSELVWNCDLSFSKLTSSQSIGLSLLFRFEKLFAWLPVPKFTHWDPELGYQDSESFRKASFIRGYFQSFRYLEALETPVPEFSQETQSRILEAQAELTRSSPVVVHIRGGDYKNHSNSHGLLGSGYLEAALETFDKDERRNIWVFTDDPNWASRLLDPLGISYEYPEELFGLTDIDSLALMSKASKFILANSTFSIVAALIAWKSNPGVTVTYPNPIFKGLETPLEMVPSSWIAVKSEWIDPLDLG
jgi:hypothetical protein